MRKKLLFISDCLDSCPQLIETLQERFDVEWFCEGAEALLHLRTSPPPSLVIVDPEIEGLADWELVRYLHSSKSCRGIPMIVISERPFEENRHLYFRYGVMDYFRKPFLNEQLIDAVEGLLVADPLERIFCTLFRYSSPKSKVVFQIKIPLRSSQGDLYLPIIHRITVPGSCGCNDHCHG